MNELIKSLNETTGYVKDRAGDLHFHGCYELIYVLEGKACIEINGSGHSLCAPAVVLLNPFEQHKILHSDENYHRFTIELDTEALERQIHPHITAMLKCRPTGFSHIIYLGEADADKIRSIFESLLLEKYCEKPYKDQFLLNEVYNLLIILYRINPSARNKSNGQMIRIQQYIDAEYADIVNVKQIADAFYLSAGHLSRAFKAFSGYSPVEYLVNTRLYHAQQLLINTSVQISEICGAVGFGDTNHFIRQFKKKFGISPSAFRKSISYEP